MTLHKVISDDSMSAMDEISKVLGNEAVILSTKKLNGKIEIIGSNDIKDVLKSNKNKPSKSKLNFHDLFAKKPLKSDQNLDKNKQNLEEKKVINHMNDNGNKEAITLEILNNLTP